MLLSDQFCGEKLKDKPEKSRRKFSSEKLKEKSEERMRNLSERMPEKKEVRKTKPIARDPTIAEEKEKRKKGR